MASLVWVWVHLVRRPRTEYRRTGTLSRSTQLDCRTMSTVPVVDQLLASRSPLLVRSVSTLLFSGPTVLLFQPSSRGGSQGKTRHQVSPTPCISGNQPTSLS